MRVRLELTHELPRYRLAPYLLGLPLHTVLSAFHRVETIGALDLAARIKQLLLFANNRLDQYPWLLLHGL